MGRTLPTFNAALEEEIRAWAPFRRALRAGDRAAFDAIMAMAKRHMAEGANAARPVPFDTVVICVLLEQQKEIERLRRLVEGTAPAADSAEVAASVHPEALAGDEAGLDQK